MKIYRTKTLRRGFGSIGVIAALGLLFATSALGQPRAFGAGAFVLDDGHGHTITILAP